MGNGVAIKNPYERTCNIFLEIQHRLNPLHRHCRIKEGMENGGLIYSPLRIISRLTGLSYSKLSLKICKYYENSIYSWVSPITVRAVKVTKSLEKRLS